MVQDRNSNKYINRETSPEVWTAPEGSMLPDLILCGAMKSGTTTLHRVLEQHPKIYFAARELHFFNIDDIVEHPNFQRFFKGRWFSQDITKDPVTAWNWYSSHFQEASSEQITGEDTTSYLSSARAIERIALQNKEIGIVILLRNPVDRTYSHYWHSVRAGRAIYSFEKTLLYEPEVLIRRSMYYEDLKRVFKHIPKDRVKIYLFEDFIRDPERIIRDLCSFLDISFSSFPHDALTLHKNRTRIPRCFGLQLLTNRLLRFRDNWRYLKFLPFHNEEYHPFSYFIGRIGKKISKFVNPMVEKRPPAMRLETRRHLTGFFLRELSGLNELLDRDVLSIWFPQDKNEE